MAEGEILRAVFAMTLAALFWLCIEPGEDL